MSFFTGCVSRSRNVAKSGTSPRYQKTSDTVKYVDTANTSQTRGEMKFTQSECWFGYGRRYAASHGRPRWTSETNIPAVMTAKIVNASANRAIAFRQRCRIKKRMAEMSVPAWPIPIQNTKFV